MKIKIEVIISGDYSMVSPLDNEKLFTHCVGTDIGGNYLSYCTIDDFENRVKELLILHGVDEFDIVTTKAVLS